MSCLLPANKKVTATQHFLVKLWDCVRSHNDGVPPSDKGGERKLGKKISTILFLQALESAYKPCLAILGDCGCCGPKASMKLKV